MKPTFYLSMALILACGVMSCSPQSKLRRAKKLIAQAEAAGVQWEDDTVFSEIKIVVPETKFDTVVNVVNWTDTITVVKDRITTRVIVNPSEKVVYISSKCDSVVVEKRVPYAVSREIKVGDSWWRNLGQAAAALIAGLVIGFILGKMIKF
jgi:hypothetical protein